MSNDFGSIATSKINNHSSDDTLSQQIEQSPQRLTIQSNYQAYCRLPPRVVVISIGIILLIVIFHSYESTSVVANEQTPLELILLEDPSALCLDGSPGGYFIQEGNPQKILIQYGSGGWALGLNYQQTIQAYYKRSFTTAGSSLPYKKVIKPSQGIFRNSQSNYFRNWTKVLFGYCDGSGYQGTRLQPILYKGRQLYFRGYNITIAQINSLNNTHQIFSPKIKQITIIGVSAGAVAAYQWINYFESYIHNQTKLHFIADSPIFLNRPLYQDNIHSLQAAYQNILNITNQQIATPLEQCNNAYPNQLWKCMFFQYFHPFVSTPVFLLQSPYDTWCIKQILKIRCQQGQNTFNSCSQSEMTVIQSYATDTKNNAQTVGNIQGNGIWAISCLTHTFANAFRYDNDNWKIPQYQGRTAAIAIQHWIQKQQINHIHIDNVNWPYNYPCSKARP